MRKPYQFLIVLVAVLAVLVPFSNLVLGSDGGARNKTDASLQGGEPYGRAVLSLAQNAFWHKTAGIRSNGVSIQPTFYALTPTRAQESPLPDCTGSQPTDWYYCASCNRWRLGCTGPPGSCRNIYRPCGSGVCPELDVNCKYPQ